MNMNPFQGQFAGVISCWFLALILISVFKPERISNKFLFRLSIALFIIQFLLGSGLSALFWAVGGAGQMNSFSRFNQAIPWLPIYQLTEIGKGLAEAIGILALFGSLAIRNQAPKKVKPPAPPKKHPLDD